MPTYTTTTVKRGGIFIPLTVYAPVVKVEVTFAGDASATDVSSRLISFRISGEINTLKTASVTLSNDEGYWVNKISGGEVVSIYLDFDAGTTKRFYGKIDEKYFSLTASDGWIFSIEATQCPELKDKTFSEQYAGESASTVIADVIDTYYSGVATHTNVPTIATGINETFSQTNCLRAFQGISDKTGYTFYIDETNDIHFIQADTQQNTTENIAFGVNLSSCSRLGENYTDIINRVIVYGQDEATNVYYLRTSSDTASQGVLWIKDNVIRNSNVTSDDEAKEVADANIDTSIVQDGSITVAGGIPTINVGEQIRVSIPYTEVMDWATIHSYSHDFSMSGLSTTVKISRTRRLGKLQKDTNEKIDTSYTAVNANGMTEGMCFNFNDNTNIESLSTCEIVDGEVRLSSGASTGTLVTVNRNTDTAFTRTSFVFDGTNMDNCTVDISTDNGTTWTSVSRTGATLVSGSQYKFRVNLSQISATEQPTLKSFGCYVG